MAKVGGFIGFVWWAAKFYIPPTDDSDREHVMRFRIAQSVGILGIWLVAWTAFTWVIGKLPFVPQVAWASDVAAVSRKVDAVTAQNTLVSGQLVQIHVLQLRTAIVQQYKNSCLAHQAKNQTDLDQSNEVLTSLLAQYHDITQHDFQLPQDCDSVLVSGNGG